MPFISLSNSELQIEVDEQDYVYLMLVSQWHLAGKGYARTNTAPYTYLHRAIANRMNLSPALEVDHTDRNKLNCKRDNLRSATRAEQCYNTGMQSNNTSGHKGISYDNRVRRRKKWIVQFQRNGARLLIGAFVTLEEAIRERDAYIKRNALTFVE